MIDCKKNQNCSWSSKQINVPKNAFQKKETKPSSESVARPILPSENFICVEKPQQMYQAKFYDISNEVDKGSVDFKDIDKKVNDLVIKNKEINVGDILFSLGRAHTIMEHAKSNKLNEHYGFYIVIKIILKKRQNHY